MASFSISNERRPNLYSEDGRTIVWRDFTTENEPGNMVLVKMNAVAVVVLGGIDFHGIGDLAAGNSSMVSTTIRTFPDYYLFPYNENIFDEAEKPFIC